jgi:hypothetical protein
MSFDQSTRLQFVQDARKGDRLDLKKLCQSTLVDPFVPSQIGQRLPLRSGQPEVARNLFKSFPQQPRDLVQQETERWQVAFHNLVTPTLAYLKLAYEKS